MAQIVFTHVAEDSPVSGGLFEGQKFWFSRSVPSRKDIIEQTKSNGGIIVALESDADIRIVDHLKKDNPVPSYSFQYITFSIQHGVRQNLENHRVGLRAPVARMVGSATATKVGRTQFTPEDDRILIEWVERAAGKHGPYKGNKIYEQLFEKNPRHTPQSWRDRYLKYLANRPQSIHLSHNAPPTPPEDPSEAAGAGNGDHERGSNGGTGGPSSEQQPEPSSDTKEISNSISDMVSDPVTQRTIEEDMQGAEGREETALRTTAITAQNVVNPTESLTAVTAVNSGNREVEERILGEEEAQTLLGIAADIILLAPDREEDAWESWAKRWETFSVGAWRRFWEEKVRPRYLAQLAKEGTEREQPSKEQVESGGEDGVADEKAGNEIVVREDGQDQDDEEANEEDSDERNTRDDEEAKRNNDVHGEEEEGVEDEENADTDDEGEPDGTENTQQPKASEVAVVEESKSAVTMTKDESMIEESSSFEAKEPQTHSQASLHQMNSAAGKLNLAEEADIRKLDRSHTSSAPKLPFADSWFGWRKRAAQEEARSPASPSSELRYQLAKRQRLERPTVNEPEIPATPEPMIAADPGIETQYETADDYISAQSEIEDEEDELFVRAASQSLSEPDRTQAKSQQQSSTYFTAFNTQVAPLAADWLEDEDEEAERPEALEVPETQWRKETQAILRVQTPTPGHHIAEDASGLDGEEEEEEEEEEQVASSPPVIPESSPIRPVEATRSSRAVLTQEEINTRLQQWISKHMARGLDFDVIELALRRTSMDPGLADMLLDALLDGAVPDDVSGVWTQTEDEMLYGGNARHLAVLEVKHGRDGVLLRQKFLKDYDEVDG